MSHDYLLDTSFLITLELEAYHGRPGEASKFLKEQESAVMHISVITYAEMCTAFEADAVDLRNQILGRYDIVHVNERIALQYAQEFARLRSEPKPVIGPNDLWIASTALVLAYPLVVRGGAQFRNVHGLSIVTI